MREYVGDLVRSPHYYIALGVSPRVKVSWSFDKYRLGCCQGKGLRRWALPTQPFQCGDLAISELWLKPSVHSSLVGLQ